MSMTIWFKERGKNLRYKTNDAQVQIYHDHRKNIEPLLDTFNPARIQLANATSDLSLRNTSFGVLKPRHFLGRLFNLSMMSTTS